MGLRIFTVNDQKATFNKIAFKDFMRETSRSNKISISKLEQNLADQLQISANTIHKWYYMDGGPIDYSTVQQLSTALGISDANLLLKFNETGEKNMTQLTERQLSAVKRIYDICIWFLHEFRSTDGFNNYWYKFKKRGSADPESDIIELADGLIAKVRLVLEQEHFDLHNCEIYKELYNYVYEDLMDTYDGKLSYAYRFEATGGKYPTTAEDYHKAKSCLDAIVAKYYNP